MIDLKALEKGEGEFGEWIFSLTEEDWDDLTVDDFVQLSQMYMIHQAGHYNAAMFKRRFEFFKGQVECGRRARERIAKRMQEEKPV